MKHPGRMSTRPGSKIRVKVVANLPTASWLHQLPGGVPEWGECRFVFERDARDYDWLVVYDDLPTRPGEPRKCSTEQLACAPRHTLLVTTEPASVKIYGNDFTRQFGAVLTSQPAWALPHMQRIHSQPALHWFYGVGSQQIESFEAIWADSHAGKSRDVSMVYSPKAMRHTLHYRRAHFMQALAAHMPELDLFGRQTARPLDDKADCLRDYRYHVAIENYIGDHHWTEKLADAFLGLSVPFYYGCPNAETYFPPESFIRIDIRDPEAAAARIRSAIANREYEQRLPALREARRRVMFEYNFFAVIAGEIMRLHQPVARPDPGARLLSRRAMRNTSPWVAARDMLGKLQGRLRHLPQAWWG